MEEGTFMLIAIIIIAVLLVAALAVLLWAYHKTFYSPYKKTSDTGDLLIVERQEIRDEVHRGAVALAARDCERVTVRAFDGVTLSARYLHHADGAPVCICFHGYRGAAVRDFSMMGPFLYDCGCNVLLVDQRAHGRSGGHTITFGIKERRDALTWAQYVGDRFGHDTPVYLFGISLGGATVLMASGLDLPANVRAISADCPFSSPKDIIKYVCSRLGMNPKLCWPIIWLAARLFGHFDPDETTAADEVKKTKVPILIIHGESDTFVPARMSEQAYEANPAMIERHTFPGAEHGLSWFYGTERYQRIVRDFLSKHP